MRTSQVPLPAPSMEEQLLEAAKDNKVEKLEYVLSHGTVNLSVTDPDSGATALHFACKNTEPQIVKLLLENGLNINAVDKIHNTALHLAALIGHKEIVTLLLDNGADLTIKNTKNETAENLASTDEIRQLIRARPGLRQFQQEQLGMKTASASQAVTPQVDEDRQLAEQLQQREFLSESLVRYPSASSPPTAASGVSAAFPVASLTGIAISQENDSASVNENIIQAKFAEMQTLYIGKNYSEAAHLIKGLLKFCTQSINEKEYREIEYQCFIALGDIYLAKDAEDKDLQDYPKAAALYQYAKRMAILGQSSEKERILQSIDRKLAEIEESFVNNVMKSVNYKCDLSLNAGYKKALEDFRLSLKPRLDAFKELGIENDELNEDRLYERAKVVEAIYLDIKNFFISHEKSNKGLLVKLINHAKTLLGAIPHEAEYAIIGLGSMALGTMTPWSDIEFAILIQDGLDAIQTKEVKDYFYKLTILLHINIINLGETELAAMAIKELNDFTQGEHDDWFWDKLMPDGVSFDAQRPIGCKTPLGRRGFAGHKDYELICTPQELAKYQSEWADHEPTLQQLLLNTVLIAGSSRLSEENTLYAGLNNSLLNLYNQLIQQELIRRDKSGLSCIQERSVKTLQKDTEKYNLWKILESGKGKLFDVKTEVYRYPDRIFVAIGSYYSIYTLSQWALIEKMRDHKIIDEKTAKNLTIAFSIACELRLSTYCNNAGQHGQFSAFKSSYITPIRKNLQTELIHYFKLTNMGALKAFFYITTMLEIKLSEYLSEHQSKKNAGAISEQLLLNLNTISLGNTTDFIKGQVSLRLMDYQSALQYLEKAKDKRREVFSYEHSNMSNIEMMFILKNLGEVYDALGDFSRAIEYFNRASVICEKEYGKHHPKMAIILNILGCSYGESGKHEEAIHYFEQARTIEEQAFNKKHVRAATILTNLGAIYMNRALYEKAIQYFEQAYAICDKKDSKHHFQVAAILDNLGQSYSHRGDYLKAINYFEQARVMYEANFGTEHIQVASILNNLGNAYRNLERNRKAIKYYEESKNIYKGQFGEEHLDLAMVLSNLGTAYDNLEDYSTAIIYYEQAKNIYITHPGKEHILATLLNNLGAAHDSLSNDRQAVKYYSEAMTICAEKFNKSSPEMARILYNLGGFYRKLNRYSESIRYYEDAHSIYEKVFDKNHPDIPLTLNELGNTHTKFGNFTKAIECYGRAIIIDEKNSGTEYKVVVSLNKLGRSYYKIANYQRAIESYKRALVLQENLSEVHHVTATIRHNLADAYNALGNYQTSIKYFKLALAIREILFSKVHPSVAGTLDEIGKAYKNLGRYKKQIKYHEKAFETFMNVFGKDDDNTKYVLSHLIEAYSNLVNHNVAEGNISLAIEYQEKKNALISLRSIKHNLACYYHIRARQALQNNDHSQYKTMRLQAKNSFTDALKLESLEPIGSTLHTEYAMFLLINHKGDELEYREIVSYLIDARELKEDESGLNYDKLERSTVVEPLQRLIDQQQNISVRPYDLASYLLIKIHLMHQNQQEAKDVFESFRQSIEEDTQPDNVGLYLLYNVGEELGLF